MGVGKFLAKFSRDAFNAETLVTDAENSRYRQAMTERISRTLRDPTSDDDFMSWLTSEVYKGRRTSGVMKRLRELAKEAVEPALFRVVEDDFVDKLKERIQKVRDGKSEAADTDTPDAPNTRATAAGDVDPQDKNKTRAGTETTEEELEFYQVVRAICVEDGVDGDEILYRDTINYFNVSYQRPTKWFLRFVSSARRKCVVTPVPLAEAEQFAVRFEVDEAPRAVGRARIYIETPAQIQDLKPLVLRSLELCRSARG